MGERRLAGELKLCAKAGSLPEGCTSGKKQAAAKLAGRCVAPARPRRADVPRRLIQGWRATTSSSGESPPCLLLLLLLLGCCSDNPARRPPVERARR